MKHFSKIMKIIIILIVTSHLITIKSLELKKGSSIIIPTIVSSNGDTIFRPRTEVKKILNQNSCLCANNMPECCTPQYYSVILFV